MRAEQEAQMEQYRQQAFLGWQFYMSQGGSEVKDFNKWLKMFNLSYSNTSPDLSKEDAHKLKEEALKNAKEIAEAIERAKVEGKIVEDLSIQPQAIQQQLKQSKPTPQ